MRSDGKSKTKWTLASGLALVAELYSYDAAAYCRTTTCDSKIETCAINPVTQCPTTGVPLYWPDTCVTFGVHRAGSPKWQVTYDKANQAAQKAFQTWISADCGGSRRPSIGVVAVGQIECDQVQYNYPEPGEDFPPGPNANVIIFRDAVWPYVDNRDNERTTLALTTITYLKDTGEIVDADIEVNSANVQLSTSDTNITNDLQAILTHEVGHFLGLAHSEVQDATMHRLYNVNVGDATFRTLSEDDRRGICDLYPPDAVTVGECLGEGPRFGFSRHCHTPVQASAGLLCAVQSVGVQSERARISWLALVSAVGAALTLAARRRT